MRFLAPIAFALALAAGTLRADTFDDVASQAASARQAEQIPRAIDLYRQALQLKPEWPEGWWFLGTMLYDSDRYSEGRDAFAKFVQLQKDPGPGWGLLGLCEFQLGHYQQSADDVRLSLTGGAGIEPQMEQVLEFHESAALTRLKLFDQAIHEYLWFPRHGIKQPTLLLGLGLAALRMPLVPQEVTEAQKPLVSTAGAATFAWMSGDASGSDTGFRELMTQFPNEPGVHYLYGTFLLGARPDAAVAEFKEELRINPRNAFAQGMLALTLVRAGDEAEALPMARAAAEGDSTAGIARYVYGLLLTRAGEKRGVEDLEAAAKLDPANLEYHLALSSAYSRFGLDENARRERMATIALARESDPHAQR